MNGHEEDYRESIIKSITLSVKGGWNTTKYLSRKARGYL